MRFKELFLKFCMKVISNLYINKRKVVFSSFSGRQLSDSPKAIFDKLIEFDNAKIIWIITDKNKVAKYKKKYKSYNVKFCSSKIKKFIHYSTAKVWVDNCTIPYYFYKNKKQFYIQTWHGDNIFKEILLLDSPMKLIEKQVCDLGVTGSKCGVEYVFRKAMDYDGEILSIGSPRNDSLVNVTKSEIKELKEKFNFINKKILLYAPTFKDYYRNNNLMENVPIDLEKTIDILEKKTGDEWIIIIRKHSASIGLKVDDISNVFDMSDYDDINDLLKITDLCVSDYSSLMIDFCLLKRPVISLNCDLDEYLKKSRKFVFSPAEVGFCCVNTIDEFYNILENFNSIDFVEKAEKIIDFYGINESGNSSIAVAKIINDKIK